MNDRQNFQVQLRTIGEIVVIKELTLCDEFKVEFTVCRKEDKFQMTFSFPKGLRQCFTWLLSIDYKEPRSLFKYNASNVSDTTIMCAESVKRMTGNYGHVTFSCIFRIPKRVSCVSFCFNNTDYSDVTVAVGSTTLHLHKLIICSASPVLRTMLSAGMSESVNNHIVIEGFEPDVVTACFRYMYDGIHSAQKIDWQEVCRMAKMYEIKLLQLYCEEQMSIRINVENCVDNLKLAQDNDYTYMLRCVRAVMSSMATEVVIHNKRKFVDVFGLEEGMDLIASLMDPDGRIAAAVNAAAAIETEISETGSVSSESFQSDS